MSKTIIIAVTACMVIAAGLFAWAWWSDNGVKSMAAMPVPPPGSAAGVAPRPPQTHPAEPPSRGPTVADKVSQAEFDQTVAQLDSADPAVRNAAAARVDNWPGDAYERAKAAAERSDAGPQAKAVLGAALSRLNLRQQWLAHAIETYQYDLKIALDAYSKSPAPSEADQAARLVISVGLKPGILREPTETSRAVADAAEAAFYGGCEDPLVTWIGAQEMSHLRVAEWSYRGPKASYVGSVKELDRSAYPPEIKAMALVETLMDRMRERLRKRQSAEDPDGDDDGREELQALAKMVLPYIPDVAKEPLHEQTIYLRMRQTYDALQPVLGCEAAYRPFQPVYVSPGARPASDLGPRNLTGWHWIRYAWEAHGAGEASTVTPQARRLLGLRLALAEKVLTSVWTERPDDARAPPSMIIVAKGYETVEPARTWFDRAMAADPDDLQACQYFVETLYPRWGGSHQAMVQFGRECLGTGNWRADLPSMMVQVHEAIGREFFDQPYFAQPSVWVEQRAYYEGYLKMYPEDQRRRLNEYARAACEAKQWAEANRLFNRVGDMPDPSVFENQSQYNIYRGVARVGEAQAPR